MWNAEPGKRCTKLPRGYQIWPHLVHLHRMSKRSSLFVASRPILRNSAQARGIKRNFARVYLHQVANRPPSRVIMFFSRFSRNFAPPNLPPSYVKTIVFFFRHRALYSAIMDVVMFFWRFSRNLDPPNLPPSYVKTIVFFCAIAPDTP